MDNKEVGERVKGVVSVFGVGREGIYSGVVQIDPERVETSGDLDIKYYLDSFFLSKWSNCPPKDIYGGK